MVGVKVIFQMVLVFTRSLIKQKINNRFAVKHNFNYFYLDILISGPFLLIYIKELSYAMIYSMKTSQLDIDNTSILYCWLHLNIALFVMINFQSFCIES